MTTEKIAQNYSALLDSVYTINQTIALVYTNTKSKDCVRRNVEHLENMTTKDYWTTEDMTTVNQAIDDGNTYLGGN